MSDFEDDEKTAPFDRQQLARAAEGARSVALESVTFQTPCDVPWESMQGNDRVRFCAKCRKNVTNVSSMARDEAEAFIAETNGSACIQIWKRPDGTVVTSDCGRPSPRKTKEFIKLGGAPPRR